MGSKIIKGSHILKAISDEGLQSTSKVAMLLAMDEIGKPVTSNEMKNYFEYINRSSSYSHLSNATASGHAKIVGSRLKEESGMKCYEFELTEKGKRVVNALKGLN